jgi:hypothetical protein
MFDFRNKKKLSVALIGGDPWYQKEKLHQD